MSIVIESVTWNHWKETSHLKYPNAMIHSLTVFVVSLLFSRLHLCYHVHWMTLYLRRKEHCMSSMLASLIYKKSKCTTLSGFWTSTAKAGGVVSFLHSSAIFNVCLAAWSSRFRRVSAFTRTHPSRYLLQMLSLRCHVDYKGLSLTPLVLILLPLTEVTLYLIFPKQRPQPFLLLAGDSTSSVCVLCNSSIVVVLLVVSE